MKRIPQGIFLIVQNRFAIKFWLFCLFFSLSVTLIFAHPITGVWRGQVQCGKGAKKITSTIEVKLVDDGENIIGTVYYLGSGKNYIRYSLKGSFWGSGNSIYWQDYSIVDMKVKKSKKVGDFNETMKYFANYSSLDESNGKLLGYCMLADMPQMNFELKKMEATLFPDEWDAVIVEHNAGKVCKEIMDSVWAISSGPAPSRESGLQINTSQIKKEPESNHLNNDFPGLDELEIAFPEMVKHSDMKNPKEPDSKPLMENRTEMILTVQGSNKGIKLVG